ncbi:linoleate 13S-lipoxygenase 2-1, chloroplastic-like protein, partial [Tanacetum coccineum]
INFGQYDFTGYFPNRPTIAGTKMPNEDTMKKSGGEKYIGGDIEEAWKVKPAIKVAFEKFKGTLKNVDSKLNIDLCSLLRVVANMDSSTLTTGETMTMNTISYAETNL